MNINLEQSLEAVGNEIKDSTLSVKFNKQKDNVGFDFIFVNEVVEKNKEKYYRLYIRPSGIWENIPSLSSCNNLWLMNGCLLINKPIKDGKVSSFIEVISQVSGKNIQIINTVNKEFFPDMRVAIKRGSEKIKNNNFSLIKIPAELISEGNLNVLSFNSILYFRKQLSTNYEEFKVSGNIYLNTAHKTKITTNTDSTKIEVKNFIDGYWHYDRHSKQRGMYKNVMEKSFTIKNKSTLDSNTLFSSYSLKSEYKTKTLYSETFDENLIEALKLISTETTGKTIPEIVTDLNVIQKSGISEDPKKYYNLKKIEFKTILSENEILYLPKLKTSYDNKTNKIIDDDFGKEGLLLNPNIFGNLVLKHRIKIKNINITIENLVDVYTNYQNQLDYLEFDNKNLLRFSKISYTLEEWDEFNKNNENKDNLTELLKYIRIHEEII